MNESHPLLQGSENIVADGGLFGARVSNKNDKLDSSEEIMRRIAEMKEKAAELRRNYEKGLESDKDRASYKAGHREVWVRRDNLLEVLMSSLRASSMIYRFATMYQIASKYKSRPEDASMFTRMWRSVKARWSSAKARFGFKTENLKIKDKNALLDRFYPGEMKLKKDCVISGIEVYQFLAENKAVMEKEAVVSDKELDPEITKTLPSGDLDYLKGSNAELVRFDNSMGNGLVYALTVNNDEKRITVTFRGSVTGTDWWYNWRWGWKTIVRDIKVHYGFYGYLYSHGTTRKINQIVQDIKDVFAEKDVYKALYTLHIVGHSLGGALAQILAYEIATTEAMKELVNPHVNDKGEYGEYGEGSVRQVTVVTFGSPFVGNRAFKEAFEEEVKHVRVTNEGDLVPTLPPRPFPYNEAYVHTGYNIHCRHGEKPILEDVENPSRTTNRGIWSQVFTWKNPKLAHNLTQYWDHLRDASLADRDLTYFLSGGKIDLDTCIVL